MHVGIIGAGMAGLSCARALAKLGHRVSVVDKGRGPGGRMSTRRVETSAGQASFDHGAQYFTVRDAGFEAVVDEWQKAGAAARWPEAGGDCWVGVPGMSAVIKHLASAHEVEVGFLAKALIRDGRTWQIVGETGTRGAFDAVVLALPAEQAASILSLHDFAMARSALLARSQPCWTAMFSFDGPVPLKSNILKDVGPLAWASRNNAKPGRDGLECWVVQGNATWSTNHLEHTPADVIEPLRAALEHAVGSPLPSIIHSSAHRWRYALSTGMGLGSLWNDSIGLGACGDWLIGPRVECAWLSGQALAAQMVGRAFGPHPVNGLTAEQRQTEPADFG